MIDRCNSFNVIDTHIIYMTSYICKGLIDMHRKIKIIYAKVSIIKHKDKKNENNYQLLQTY